MKNYKMNWRKCYRHDERKNVHRIELVHEDDEFYYVVPINQVQKIPKNLEKGTGTNRVIFDAKEAYLEMMMYRLENGDKIDGLRNKEESKEAYEEIVKNHSMLLI